MNYAWVPVVVFLGLFLIGGAALIVDGGIRAFRGR